MAGACLLQTAGQQVQVRLHCNWLVALGNYADLYLAMTETRPRHYAAELLKDIRPFVVDWMNAKGVPVELQRLVLKHVVIAVDKSLNKRRAK